MAEPTPRYDIEYGKEGAILVGERDLEKCKGKGVAQLANDAVSVALHGHLNNCHFVEQEGVMWLQSKQDIKQGAELLVNYGIEYWESEILRNPNEYSTRFKLEVRRNRLLIDGLKSVTVSEVVFCAGWSLRSNVQFSCGSIFACPSGAVHYNLGTVGMLKIRPSRKGVHTVDFVCAACQHRQRDVIKVPILRKLAKRLDR